MTEKERFLATLLGDGADRFPFFDLEPDDETVRIWRRRGLPKRTSVAKYFQLETPHNVGLVVRSAPFYEMAPDLLHDSRSFERHYDPDDPDRYAKGFVRKSKKANRKGQVVSVDASGGGLLQMLGVGDWDTLVSACEALARRPSHVQQLMERTTDFHCTCLDRALSAVTVDYATVYEPIASNTGPVVSPEMFRRYSIPGYRKVMQLLEGHGVALRILCTTGGDLSSLLPDLIESGINGLWISNIMSSHMEYEHLRREYGSDIALIGGIDSTALSEDANAVRRAVHGTVPPLLEGGRYLPCLDDRPRTTTSFSLYRLYRELLAEMV